MAARHARHPRRGRLSVGLGTVFWAATVSAATADDAAAMRIDPGDYLAQSHCPDGAPPLPENCAAPVAQRAGDTMTWRRRDWPAPAGYFASDSVAAGEGRYVTTWNFGATGRFDAARGDGGEVYLAAGDTVRIVSTQDGGRPGMQYFAGPRCGGDGWLAFRADAAIGAWHDAVARLAIGTAPEECPPLDRAYTRWRRATFSVPFVAAGVRRDLAIDAVIGEHFGGGSIAEATAAEQFVWAKGWGRIWWAAYGLGPATVDLSQRCPAVPFGVSPRPDWQLHDCRLATVIAPTAAPWRPTDFGWPQSPLAGPDRR